MSHSAEDIADHTPYAGEKSGWRIPLLVCGIVAGPLFFAIFLIAGALRPDYDPLRHPVSSLELGPTGWVQSLNFILTGTLVVLFGIGIRSTVRKLGGGRTVPILFMLVGAGLIGAGLFAPDPLSGYPPGTPPRRCFALTAPGVARPLLNAGVHRIARGLHHLVSALSEAPQNRLGDLLRPLGRNDDHLVRDVQHRICAGITIDTNRWPVTAPHARGGLPLDGTAWIVEFDDTNQSLKACSSISKGP